jgi:hypothetical protein
VKSKENKKTANLKPSSKAVNEDMVMRDRPAEVVEHDRTPDKMAASTPSSVYCICRQAETPDMIGCDDCDNWFHPKCLEKMGIDIS